MMATPERGPLHGIRVLDLATERAELAGRILSDLGAEVIKVEPTEGAAVRRLPPFDEQATGESLYWAAVGLGKRSVVLDLHAPADAERLRGLIAGADMLIESFTPGTLAALGLSYEDVRPLNPALVYVSVTPFGQNGPEAQSPASELTIEAASGLLNLIGDGDRPPVPIGYPQAAFNAGGQAAADALLALFERERSGFGQHVDVSMQATLISFLLNASGYPPYTGGNPPRTCEQRNAGPSEIVPGVVLPRLARCADGWVALTLALGEPGALSFERLMRSAGELGFLAADLLAIDWRNWLTSVATGTLEAGTVRRGLAGLQAYLLTQDKRALMQRAIDEHLLLAPLYTTADLLADPQLSARDYWQQVGGRTHPGPFARFSATPIALRTPAPALAADQALLDAPQRRPSAPNRIAGARRSVFDGLKVADFAWVAAGPNVTRALSAYGATVVRIESETRPDLARLIAPYMDNKPGINRNHPAANYNLNKLGMALNLGTPEGRVLARRLVDWADVVVESFSPGAMARLGLGYDEVSRDHLDLVMLSSCMRGQTGPERLFTGTGAQGSALAGFEAITGWPDRPPCGIWGAYTDFVTPRFAVPALVAALIHRRRTGEGQYIDLSQVEAGIHFLEPLVLDYSVNGRVAEPPGHISNRACPHGVYQTAGVEEYVALAVETSEQWRRLLSVAPLDAFASDDLNSLQGRLRHREAIDNALRSWLRQQDRFEIAARLRRAGVPAYAALRPTELYSDPQLAQRGFFVTLEHAEVGVTQYDGLPSILSATPGRLTEAGPCLGQHTQRVLQDLLGCSEDEIAGYAAAGALR